MVKQLFVAQAIALVSINLCAGQVIGKTFPNLTGETVNNKKVNLPRDTKGKFTLIGMAFSKKSEADLNTWLNPVYSTFIEKQTGPIQGFSYDVNVYFVPMFTGITAAATNTAKKLALQSIDPILFPYMLFYKGELQKYKDALKFDKGDIPYFFVLDPNGKIVFATEGAYSKAKMESVEAVIDF
jgi:hypothetical protein